MVLDVTDDKIRVLIADDQSIIREGLQILLASEAGIEVVGIADNGKSALEAIALLQPDVALIDIEMPHMDGLATAKVLCQRHPNVKILILSSHDDRSYLLDALQAGASGYLLKSTAATDVAKTIRSVHRGHLVFGPGMSAPLVAQLLARESDTPNIQAEMLDVVRATFDSERLRSSAQHFARHPQARELWKALTDEIYGDNTNLAGPYLAGWFAHNRDRNTALAMHYFASGFERGLQIHAERKHLEAFYQAGKTLHPEVAFGWLLQATSPWQQSPTDRSALLIEAAAVFGVQSSTYQRLLIRTRIQALEQMSDRLARASSKLSILQQGFDAIPASDRELKRPALLMLR